jgi:hypothetical protein
MHLNLEYVAGLFDAEGSVGLYGRKSRNELRFSARVVGVERLVLEILRNQFGGIVAPMKSKSRSQEFKRVRPAWVWQAEYRTCLEFIPKIVGELLIKRREAELLIASASLIGRNGVRLTDDDKRRRAEAIREMSAMKKISFEPDHAPSKIYLAGFFDGDGSLGVSVTKKGYAHISASLYNTNRPILEAVQIQYGGSIKKGMKRGANRRPYFQIELCGDGAHRFLSDVKSHSILKKPQIELAIEFHERKALMKSEGLPLKGEVTKFGSVYKKKISNLNQGLAVS